MTDAEYQLLFDETDHKGDGQIDFEDFMRMMMSKWIVYKSTFPF